MIFLHDLKQASAKKETNHELTKDNKGMVALTQKGENENLTKNIFRIIGGNERSFTLIKPQGNDRVTARLLPQISWPVTLASINHYHYTYYLMHCWITVDFEDLLGQTIWTTTMQ